MSHWIIAKINDIKDVINKRKKELEKDLKTENVLDALFLTNWIWKNPNILTILLYFILEPLIFDKY